MMSLREGLKVDWKSTTAHSGGQFVMIGLGVPTPQLLVDNSASLRTQVMIALQHLGRFICTSVINEFDL